MQDKSKKIIRKSAVDLVYEQMKDMIKNTDWPVRDKIPSESELAEMFDVNRLTVRMALQKLNTLGLVETRAGEGTFVTAFNFSDYIKQASEFYSEEMFQDIADFRKAVELACCRLAMDRCTSEELEELKLRLDAHNKQTESYNTVDPNAFLALVDADLAFHEFICEMSGNSLLILAFQMAREAIYRYLIMIAEKRMTVRHERLASNKPAQSKLHTVIYDAIARKDFATCEKAYKDMIDPQVNIYEL